MKGAIDLTKSERGVLAILVITCATVLVSFGKIDADHWTTIVKWTVVVVIAGKTLRSSSPDPEPSQDSAAPLPEARAVDGSTGKV